MFKKYFFIAVAVTFIFSVFFGSTSIAKNTTSENFVLKYQAYIPRTGLWFMQEQLKDRLEKMSNGRIKLEMYAAGEIVSSPDILDAVKSGVVDIGYGLGQYYSGFKLGPIEGGLPFSWLSLDEADVVYRSLGLEELLRKEYAKHGVHYLGPGYEDPYCIVSTKPIKSLSDLSKMKIRMLAGPAKVTQKVGGKGVYIPFEEVYMGITTGTIDGGLFAGAKVYTVLKYPEICKYYLKTPFVNPVVSSFIINQKKWESLPADIQEILSLAVYKQGYVSRVFAVSGEYESWENFEVTELAPEEVGTLTKAAVEVWEEEAQKSPEAAKAIELIKKLNRSMGRIE